MVGLEEETMSVAEAAKVLGVHPATVVRAIHDGRLKTVTEKASLAIRVKAYRIPVSEVERLRQSAQGAPGGE